MTLTVIIMSGWMLLAVLGVANGILREKILKPVLSTAALPVSGLTLSIFIGITVYVINPAQKRSQLTAFGVGLVWVLMTVIFECILGRVQGKSWLEISRAYTLQNGNLWSVVMLILAISPWCAFVLR